MHAKTSPGVDTTVEMSSAVCPGVRSNRTEGAEFGPVRVTVDPAVPDVHGPVIVNPRRREQRGVDRVIGMMVAEHHVGHVPGLRAVPGQGGQQGLAGGHHAGIDDDHRVAVQDQRDRPGDSLVVAVAPHIPLVQHVHQRGPARLDLQLSSRADLTGQRRGS